MAPLFLIAVAVAGVFVRDGRVEAELVEQMRSLVGEEGAVLAETVIENTESEWRSSWSLLVGIVLDDSSGATTVFGQLQHALNRVWRVEAAPGTAIWDFVKQRLLSFALVLAIGFLLMVSLVISAVLAALHSYLDARFEGAAVSYRHSTSRSRSALRQC